MMINKIKKKEINNKKFQAKELGPPFWRLAQLARDSLLERAPTVEATREKVLILLLLEHFKNLASFCFGVLVAAENQQK